MGPGVCVICITLTSLNFCAKTLFIQLQTRSCIGCQTNVATTTPRQLKVGKAWLWSTHRKGSGYGLAFSRVRWYLKLFWEGGFSTQIRWRCQNKGGQIVMARWYRTRRQFHLAILFWWLMRKQCSWWCRAVGWEASQIGQLKRVEEWGKKKAGLGPVQ